MQGVDGEAANEETASSEEDNDEDPDGVLTRLQSAMLQVRVARASVSGSPHTVAPA